MSDKNFLSGLNAKRKPSRQSDAVPKSFRLADPQPAEQFDVVNKARHYNVSPSGVECIVVVEHMNFCCGNAVKYVWRADEKGNATAFVMRTVFSEVKP